MTYVLDFIIAATKISIAPVAAFMLVALAVGIFDHSGGDERLGLLTACFALLVVSIANAIVFWCYEMYRTAIIGGGLWIAYNLACIGTVLAFWGG